MKLKYKDLHRVTSTAIIHKDGKYLIARRSLEKKSFPGKWIVPGGGLETDDYFGTPPSTPEGKQWYGAVEKSLRREILEETGLEVGALHYLLDLTFIIPDGTPAVVLSFYADWKSGEVVLDKESMEYAWVTPVEAKNYDLIEGIAEEIALADKAIKDRLAHHGEYEVI